MTIRPLTPKHVAPKVESPATPAAPPARPAVARAPSDSFVSGPRPEERLAASRPAGGTSRASVRFDDLFAESIRTPVVAGGTLRLDYDAAGLRRYLGEQDARGSHAFGIDAFVSFNYGPAQRVPLAGFERGELKTHEAAIAVPADAKNVRVWFRGASAFSDGYDSGYGANYELPVVGG